MMAQELQDGSADREPVATDTPLIRASSRSLPLRSRWNPLALMTLTLRLGLIALVTWAAWRLIAVSVPLGTIRWAILVPAIAAANAILFSAALDLETAVALRAVRGASFTPDPWGGRSETVRIHAEAHVHEHGRRPTGAHVLHDVYSGEAFTVVYTNDNLPVPANRS